MFIYYYGTVDLCVLHTTVIITESKAFSTVTHAVKNVFLCPKGGRASSCHVGLFTSGFVYFQYGNALSTVSLIA